MDFKSPYNCHIKLGTTSEKCFMIDIISLDQSYKRYEITDITRIHGRNNPANSMIKSKPSSALKIFIDTNCINLDITEWVQRAVVTKETKGK